MAACKTLLVARVEPPSAEFCAKAAQLGLDVWHRSMLRVELAERSALRAALASVPTSKATLVFTSRFAARSVKAQFPEILSQHALMAVGASTAEALKPYEARCPNQNEGAQALLDLLPNSLSGQNFCLIQAPDALTTLKNALHERAAEVIVIEAYTRIHVAMQAIESARLQSLYCVDAGSGAQLQALFDEGLPLQTALILPSERVRSLALSFGLTGQHCVSLSDEGSRLLGLLGLLGF